MNKNQDLHKKLHQLKKKITLAKLNNEDYRELEKKVDLILKEIGYEVSGRKSPKAFQGYREVPTNGYIRVFRGGKCK